MKFYGECGNGCLPSEHADESILKDYLEVDWRREKWTASDAVVYHDEEKHAIIWSIHNAVPLSQFAGGGINLVKYEDLVSDTEGCMRALTASIGGDFDERGAQLYTQPSNTSSLSTALEGAVVANRRWESRLSEAQIERIMRIVEAFGLGGLYQ